VYIINMPTIADTGNSDILYTYTSFVTTVNNIQTTVNILTNMSFNYVEGGNTVATLPNFITEIAENFADGSVTTSLQNITQLIIGENVTYYKKGICKNWTSLTHLRLNQTIAPTVEHESSYFSYYYPNVPAPTSFYNSALNTLSLYIDIDVYNILQYLLGSIVYQIVTLNVIDILNQSFSGSDSVLIIASNLRRPDRFQIINVTSINILTDTNVLPASFIGFINLTSVNMPLVINIDSLAFAADIILPSVLTSINMPLVRSIGPDAFSHCIALTSVHMPSVRYLNNQVFYNCTSLTSVIMPSVTSIGNGSFENCPINIQSLQQLYYQGFLEIKTNGTYGIGLDKQRQIQTYDITGTTITRILTTNPGSYYINIPNTIITDIAENAATGATFITSLTIPASVTFIGANAFSGCSNLTSVTLPGFQNITLVQGAFSNTNVSQASLQAMLDQGYAEETLRVAGFTIVPDTPVTPVPCFNEDSKILCLVDGQEKELLVQNIRNGVLVKTLHSGYQPVCMIGTSVICNPGTDERFKDRLFICKKEKYPELNQDLIITGCHSILVDNITVEQREQTMIQMKNIYVTEGKYRLNANLDDRAQPYNSAGNFNIYHIALENENYYKNYGVYANGLLVETCSKRYLKELSNMTLL
jgi:hypothetical protein